MKITKRLIDLAAYQGTDNNKDIRWDNEPIGFGVRIYPSDRKIFVLSYRAKGRKKQITIGQFGVLTVDQARKWLGSF